MSLQEYARKRDFAQTSEPAARAARTDAHRFVVQKHAARRLHYDFRLEINGTLKSWAVPKGIPLARGDKRLAVQVEDHPVGYINFEGTIPQGQYGGGTVMVWDRGTFTTETSKPLDNLNAGKLHFELAGKKLRGEWHLVRLRQSENWLLIKGGESLKPISSRAEDTSALSGKTMHQIARGSEVWESHRNQAKAATGARLKDRIRARVSNSQPARTRLRFIEPMKARLVESPPKGDWLYEIKFDGFRAVALKEGTSVRVYSRNEKDFGRKFPEVAESVAQVEAAEAILDGEIVALDREGRSSFQLLQAFELGQERPPIFFYVFDLLRMDGKDLKSLPLEERQARLAELLRVPPGVIRHSRPLGGNATKLLVQVKKLGLEGLLGKRSGSVYEPGRRSGAWVKLKVQAEAEFVIGGYTRPEGTRKHFGALLVGVYEGRRLRFCGKVGTGFDTAGLKNLFARLQPLRRAECPFADLPEQRAGRYGAGVTKAEMKRCTWVNPELVCQIKFSSWTRDNKLRQPVFLGLREDKEATEVVRERAA